MTNIRYFSSYGMDDATLRKYSGEIIKYQPRFLRGYASALNAFASFIANNYLKNALNIQAVFSTSEVLIDNNRENIERVFNCEVYDCWGVNDGGATAFECHQHNGMHVDIERAFIEVVPVGLGEEHGFGKIIVSSLLDKAMPFIRYDTGDIGRLENDPCKCGCIRPRLFITHGRITDYFRINNKIVGTPVFTVLMGKLAIDQYQIVKKAENHLVVRVVKGRAYSSKDEDFISRSLRQRLGKVRVQFEYLDKIIPPDGMKHKFIVDESF